MHLPEETRQHYGDASNTCHAYSIRDARMLLAQIQKTPSQSLPSPLPEKLHLDPAFQLEVSIFQKELFKELILDTIQVEKKVEAPNSPYRMALSPTR